ncbi:MAG: nitroreductase family protein, partial [Candidatus Latescibacterota bacterium]
AAAAEGLGTCWIGAFQQEQVRRILGVPETCQVTLLMTVGHPADEPGERTRKSLEELVCWEEFS